MSPESSLLAGTDRALAWLRHSVWPTWMSYGIDYNKGGFHEHLTLDRLVCNANFRRLRVAARQTYVFSEAAIDGLVNADAVVKLGVEFLLVHAKQECGGYASRFGTDGMVVDGRFDLYDHAFVLLALSSAHRSLPDERLYGEALALDTVLQSRFRHPAGGFIESLPTTLPRRQNPHMHLLEANLHAFESFGDPLWLDRADYIVRLFFDRLFVWDVGALPEYFNENWSVVMEGQRFRTEPGHHFEWIWLLIWYQKLGGRVVSPSQIASAIYALGNFADSFGCHPSTGWLIDEVWSDGTPCATTARLWPQTERLKAELYASVVSADRISNALRLLERFRACETDGLWQEMRDATGSALPGVAPASSLYHITSSILACLRFHSRDIVCLPSKSCRHSWAGPKLATAVNTGQVNGNF